MRRVFCISVCVVSVCIIGCGVLGKSGMQLGINGDETTIDTTSAFVAPNSSGGHSIQITNYPVEMGDSYDYSKIKAKEDGQYRLDVMIVKETADGKRPVVAGEYQPQPSNEKPKDKLVRARIMRFEGGKEKEVALLESNSLQGAVKIHSVEGELVKGTIDVSDGKSLIKGDFTARTLK
jgi:hypothetical protein